MKGNTNSFTSSILSSALQKTPLKNEKTSHRQEKNYKYIYVCVCHIYIYLQKICIKIISRMLATQKNMKQLSFLSEQMIR